MFELFNLFPRQVGLPRQIVYSKKELLDIINKYNGKKRLFVSVYNYISAEHDSYIKLDKVFFDFDEDDAIEDAKKLHYFCVDQNIRHIMFFSGRGFHIYLLTKNFENICNVRACLYNVHHYFIKKLNVKLDEKIKGDIARLATCPNTFNLKRNRYCIPISEQDLEKGYDYIVNLAKKQRFEYFYYCNGRFNVKKFDETNTKVNKDISYSSDFDIKANIQDVDITNDFLESLPPCIKSLLTSGKHVGWKERGYIICYLRDIKGLLLEETISILKKYLNERDYKHSVHEEKQPQYLYRNYVRDRVIFPRCERLKMEGLCPIDGYCKQCRAHFIGNSMKIVSRM